MHCWYLIHCKAHQDDKAEHHLRTQDFEVFRPKIRARGRGRKRGSPGERTRLESLFPSYLFIGVDPQLKSIAPVSSTPGVAGPVRFGASYATAPEALIERLKRDVERLASAGPVTWKPGQPVRVEHAGFDGIEAVYCNPQGAQRSAVLVEMLGGQRRVVVPTDCVRAA